MAKIKVSELAQLNADRVNEETSLLAVDNLQSYQLRYGFLSSNLSSSLYRPLAETVSAECDIQLQKDDISKLTLSCTNLSDDITLSVDVLNSDLTKKIDNDVAATKDNFGLIKTGYTQAGNNYPVNIDDSGNAYVSVTGGSGGSDARVDLLVNISSYYASIDNVGNITDKVSAINTTFTSKTNEIDDVIQLLCIDIITGQDQDEEDPTSLSINFENYRKVVAGISASQDTEDIEITSGILYDLISSDNFEITGNVEAGDEKILKSTDIFKAGYLAIGLQITESPQTNIELKDRYIDNITDNAYVCINVKNTNTNTNNENVIIKGIVTYLHTSKIYTIG